MVIPLKMVLIGIDPYPNDRGYDAERDRAKQQWHVFGAAVQRHNDRLEEIQKSSWQQ